jgi:hypothetical protein
MKVSTSNRNMYLIKYNEARCFHSSERAFDIPGTGRKQLDKTYSVVELEAMM